MIKDRIKEIEDRLAHIEHCLKTTDNYTPFKTVNSCDTCRRREKGRQLPKDCNGCHHYVMHSVPYNEEEK